MSLDKHKDSTTSNKLSIQGLFSSLWKSFMSIITLGYKKSEGSKSKYQFSSDRGEPEDADIIKGEGTKGNPPSNSNKETASEAKHNISEPTSTP